MKVNRQSLRKSLLFVSFLFFPITLYYFSPMLSLSGAYNGILSGSCLVFGLLFISSLLFGRGFCAWVCPAGGLQENFPATAGKRRFQFGWKNWLKYVLWVPWFSSIILLFFLAKGEKKVQIFYQLSSKISILEDFALIIYFSLTILIIILSLAFGKRAFCHMICWMAPFMVVGNTIKRVLKIPSLHLGSDSAACISCNRCTKNCSMSLDVKEMVLSGSMEHKDCILCGECIDTCPNKAIQYRFDNKYSKK